MPLAMPRMPPKMSPIPAMLPIPLALEAADAMDGISVDADSMPPSRSGGLIGGSCACCGKKVSGRGGGSCASRGMIVSGRGGGAGGFASVPRFGGPPGNGEGDDFAANNPGEAWGAGGGADGEGVTGKGDAVCVADGGSPGKPRGALFSILPDGDIIGGLGLPMA